MNKLNRTYGDKKRFLVWQTNRQMTSHVTYYIIVLSWRYKGLDLDFLQA